MRRHLAEMFLREDSQSLATRGTIAVLLCGSILLAGQSVAWAAATVGNQPDGRLAGYVAGATILLLVGYSLFLCLRPILRRPDSGLDMAILILVAIWLIKQSLLPLLPGFGVDVGSYQAWASRLADIGPARMYAPGYFVDYPPGYLYALWAVGGIGHFAGISGDAFRQLTESPALIADLLLGLVVFAYLRRTKSLAISYAGMLMAALNPAMLFETVVWGQSDSVPTLLMFLSVTSALDNEFELSWALAAVGVLAKPQVLFFLPVLGLWTLLRGEFEQWWRAALAFVAMAVITAVPFQIAHSWSWLPSLYVATTSYYHETSVNAFNLIALLSGLRQPDEATILGLPCFYVGMGLVVLLLAFIAWTLVTRPSEKSLFYCTFMAVFGSFMVAPRMHERYVYPALAFAIPLALEDPLMLLVFGALSLTFLFNLAYVKHTLESAKIFLDPRDKLAMLDSAINTVLLAPAASYALSPAGYEEEEERPRIGLKSIVARLRAVPTATQPRPVEASVVSPLKWLRIDTTAIAVLVAGALATRLWRLGLPAEIVFDEVHFVGQARHYLHGESFLDPHPPLAKLVIAAGIWLFGDHPWSWRIGNALIGTALVAITYLLGRRLFHSRLGAALAAAFVLGDGMFLVDSRIAVLDIVYITCAAAAYLLLFRFVETADALSRRRTLVWMGIALGLCLSAKLYIPAVTFLLVVGFLVYALWEISDASAPERARNSDPNRNRRVAGALLLTGAISAAVYIAVFLPHFLLGWWGGIADLVHYYSDVIWYERSVSSATHPYSSPWWSWPLMLRPIAYWQNWPSSGDVATIWGGGNPASWWGALSAIAIVAVQAFERRSLWRPFLIIGYLSYLAIWVPIGRTLFLYHYMGSEYLAYLALGAVLAEFWLEGGQPWEHLALLLMLAPVFILGLPTPWGALVLLAVLGGYATLLLRRPEYAGKYACAAFVGVVLVVFVYYLPLWVGLQIHRSGYYARMWLQGQGLRSWI